MGRSNKNDPNIGTPLLLFVVCLFWLVNLLSMRRPSDRRFGSPDHDPHMDGIELLSELFTWWGSGHFISLSTSHYQTLPFSFNLDGGSIYYSLACSLYRHSGKSDSTLNRGSISWMKIFHRKRVLPLWVIVWCYGNNYMSLSANSYLFSII